MVKRILFFWVLLLIVPNIVAAQIVLEKENKEYLPQENFQGQINLKEQPIEPLNPKDIFWEKEGQKLKISPILISIGQQRYGVYFKVPIQPEGVANWGVKLLYIKEGVLKEVEQRQEVNIREGQAVEINPPIIKILEEASNQLYEISLKNKGQQTIQVNLQENETFLVFQREVITINPTETKKAFLQAFTEEIENRTEAKVQVSYKQRLYSMPIYIEKVSEENKTTTLHGEKPEQQQTEQQNQEQQQTQNQTIDKHTADVKQNETNQTNKAQPEETITKQEQEVMFIVANNRIERTLQENKRAGGPLGIKSNMKEKPSIISIVVKGGIADIIDINQSTLEIPPEKTREVYLWINKEGQAEPKTYTGTIEAEMDGRVLDNIEVLIKIEREEQGIIEKGQKDKNILAPSREEQEELLDTQFIPLNFSLTSEIGIEDKQRSQNKAFILLLTISMVIAIFIFYKEMTRTKKKKTLKTLIKEREN